MLLEDETRRGIALVAEEAGLRPEDVNRVSAAIASKAVYDIDHRRGMLLDLPRGSIVVFNLVKAVTAAAGVLGAVVAVVAGPATLPAVLSAVAALGSLQGLSERLPPACAQVVALLLESQDRKLTRGELQSRFEDIYDGPAGELQRELDRALEKLESSKSISIELGTVRLVERIVIQL